MTINETLNIGRGKVAYLLKGSSKRSSIRKDKREYPANLNILKKNDNRLHNKDSKQSFQRNASRRLDEENKDEDEYQDMNVDQAHLKSQQLKLTDLGFQKK